MDNKLYHCGNEDTSTERKVQWDSNVQPFNQKSIVLLYHGSLI